MATAAPEAPTTEATAPGEEKKKKTKTVKPKHPSISAAQAGEGKGLTEIPADYVIGGKYQLLKEVDFDPVHIDQFFVAQARYLQGRADSFFAKAKSWSKLGGIADRATALKVLQAQEEIRKLTEQLAAGGNDMSGLFTPEELEAILNPDSGKDKK